ncbi:MAG: hypothetical protein ACM3MG_02790 [Bacillota bacterium]
MKKMIVLAALLVSSSALADNACKQQDAQIIAHVKSITDLGGGDLCLAKLSFTDGHDMFNTNYACPLEQREVVSKGVMVECSVQAGEQVDGMLYKCDGDSTIYLY